MKTEEEVRAYGDRIYNAALDAVEQARIVFQAKEILHTVMLILEDNTLYDLSKLEIE